MEDKLVDFAKELSEAGRRTEVLDNACGVWPVHHVNGKVSVSMTDSSC